MIDEYTFDIPHLLDFRHPKLPHGNAESFYKVASNASLASLSAPVSCSVKKHSVSQKGLQALEKSWKMTRHTVQPWKNLNFGEVEFG